MNYFFFLSIAFLFEFDTGLMIIAFVTMDGLYIYGAYVLKWFWLYILFSISFYSISCSHPLEDDLVIYVLLGIKFYETREVIYYR